VRGRSASEHLLRRQCVHLVSGPVQVPGPTVLAVVVTVEVEPLASSICLGWLRRLLRAAHGVRVSSPARSWTLRSSAAREVGAPSRERRTIRTTWRRPPQGQGVGEDP
jgi:hypothetical protein